MGHARDQVCGISYRTTDHRTPPVVGHPVQGRQRCRDKRRWRSLRDEDLYRRIFQGKRLGERGIGAGTLAKTRQRMALELLFSSLAYIGADGEAEQMLGVDRVGTRDDRP